MILFQSLSSFKVVQIVPVHYTSRAQELKKDVLTENLKKNNLLVWNQKAQVFDIWSSGPLAKLFKL